MTEPAFIHFTLSNGLRVIHRPINRPVGHLGLIIAAGSRDELEGEEGLAHFVEHSIFKGTGKRKAYHILNRLDSVGGELDAYTTKEITCLYGSFLQSHYERAIELLSDITFNSSFPEKELEKEKEVVLDEINVYQDSPSDQIFDDFEEQIFAGHPLSHGILGKAESVRAFNREKTKAFTDRLYRVNRMVISSVGNISAKRLERMLEKHFGNIATQNGHYQCQAFHPNAPQKKLQHRQTYQTHCIIGRDAYSYHHPKQTAMVLLNNLFGGPAMNSILNLKVREKYGFTYNIESHYGRYADTGLFSIYLGADDRYVDRCLQAVYREMKKLREKALSPLKLNQAKLQLKGQIALGSENNSSVMLSYGKSMLVHDRIESLAQIYDRIEAVTASDLLEVANEMLEEQHFHELRYSSK